MDKYGPLVETDQWMISLGYFSEESIETVGSELPPRVDRHTGEEYPKDVYKNTPARSLPKEITMERLKKDYFDLFYYDIYEFFSCGHEHVVHNQPGGYGVLTDTLQKMPTEEFLYLRASVWK